MKRYKNKKEEYTKALELLQVALEGKGYLLSPSKIIFITYLIFTAIIISPTNTSVYVTASNVALPIKPRTVAVRMHENRTK